MFTGKSLSVRRTLRGNRGPPPSIVVVVAQGNGVCPNEGSKSLWRALLLCRNRIAHGAMMPATVVRFQWKRNRVIYSFGFRRDVLTKLVHVDRESFPLARSSRCRRTICAVTSSAATRVVVVHSRCGTNGFRWNLFDGFVTLVVVRRNEFG